MESSKVMAVATEIRDQLVVLTNRNILLSWGIEGYKAVIYNEMHSLQIKVNGRLFQGNVLICLNPIDHYEIYLSNNKETRCICDMAYFDMLGDIITPPLRVKQTKSNIKSSVRVKEPNYSAENSNLANNHRLLSVR
jgi:hypothetical protein BACCOPRO_01507